MKLCRDCKHFTTIVHYALCDHPLANHSTVDGSPVHQCQFMRESSIGKCGPSAKLFEAKPIEVEKPKKSFWQIFLSLSPGNGSAGNKP